MIYAVSIISTLIFVFYSKWQFSDDKGENSGRWHPFGMAMRLATFIGGYLLQHYSISTWQDYLLSGSICMVVWEIGINLIALAQKWNYIGGTAKTDIKFRKYHWLIYFGFLGIAILIRIFVR